MLICGVFQPRFDSQTDQQLSVDDVLTYEGGVQASFQRYTDRDLRQMDEQRHLRVLRIAVVKLTARGLLYGEEQAEARVTYCDVRTRVGQPPGEDEPAVGGHFVGRCKVLGAEDVPEVEHEMPQLGQRAEVAPRGVRGVHLRTRGVLERRESLIDSGSPPDVDELRPLRGGEGRRHRLVAKVKRHLKGCSDEYGEQGVHNITEIEIEQKES